MSSLADEKTRALGSAHAADLFAEFPAGFAGQEIDETSILIKLTLYGDANLNGVIDGADITTVGQNWMAAGDWSSGDFNYDGFVDITDLWLLASNRRDSQYALDQALLDIGLLAVNAPEPSAMLVTAALLGLLPRRRSNRTVEKQ